MHPNVRLRKIMTLSAIIQGIVSNLATMGLKKAVTAAFTEYSMKTGNTTEHHRFPKAYTGRVIVKVQGLKKVAKALVTWGDYNSIMDLEATDEQYILLDKRHEDATILSVAVDAKCQLSFSHVIMDGNDTTWHHGTA